MGVGYLGLFDRIDHTSSSEWSDRGVPVTTEQVHHTAYPNDAGSRALMDPGGRTVSANGLLLRDGTLVEVVPGQFRAFTSASAADRYSLTVETVNQTGGPEWGISEAQRIRLAKLNRDMAAAGLAIGVGKRGTGGIQGHFEVPGSYATACPGPSMQLDHIAALAASGNLGGGDPTPDIPIGRKYPMYAIVPEAYSDAIWLQSTITGKKVLIMSPYDVGLLQRVRNNDNDDEMLGGELAIVEGYLKALDSADDDRDALLAAIANVKVSGIDRAVLREELDAALADAEIEATVDTEALADRVVAKTGAALSNG